MKISNPRGRYLYKMKDLNESINQWKKNLEPVSFKISTNRPLVNRIAKESNLSSNGNLDLNQNFNIST